MVETVKKQVIYDFLFVSARINSILSMLCSHCGEIFFALRCICLRFSFARSYGGTSNVSPACRSQPWQRLVQIFYFYLPAMGTEHYHKLDEEGSAKL